MKKTNKKSDVEKKKTGVEKKESKTSSTSIKKTTKKTAKEKKDNTSVEKSILEEKSVVEKPKIKRTRQTKSKSTTKSIPTTKELDTELKEPKSEIKEKISESKKVDTIEVTPKLEQKVEHKLESQAKHKIVEKKLEHKISRKPEHKLEQETIIEQQVEHKLPVSPIVKEEKVKPSPKIKINFGSGLSPQEISQIINHPVSEVITTLMRLGSIFSATKKITDVDTIEILLSELGIDAEIVVDKQVEKKEIKKEEPKVKLEEKKVIETYDFIPRKEGKTFVKKIPVVTIMGHVDHGKTTLLDTIRKSNIAANEYGFITQHIGAYMVKTPNGEITFIDTPGHEAFSSLRSRGASVTDIVVLVVAGDEGVMPQTIESINHAKLSKVPIIVAVNKMDLAGFNLQKVKQQLSEHGLLAHDWGGDVEFVEISARNNINIDKLLDTILLQAEIMDLKAPIDVPAEGTIIETKLDPRRGNVATVIISKGKLSVGEYFVVGKTYGKVKAIISDTGERLKEICPGAVGEIMGFEELPQPGDLLLVVENERDAKRYSEMEQERLKKVSIEQKKKLTFEDIISGKSRELRLVIKTDTQGSLEAIKKMLDTISNEVKDNPDAAKINVVHTGVGEINESDVLLASAGNSIIIGFNIRPTTQAIKVAKHEGVEIKTYRTIYDLTDDVKNILKGLEIKKEKEEFLGRAVIKKVFDISKVGKIAGCIVEEGKIVRNAKVRVLRDNVIIAETKIISLKRFKDDVKEVEKGFECGIGLENLNDIKENDVIESYQIVVEK